VLFSTVAENFVANSVNWWFKFSYIGWVLSNLAI